MAGPLFSKRTLVGICVVLVLIWHGCHASSYSKTTVDGPSDDSRNGTIGAANVNNQDVVNEIEKMVAAWNDQVIDRNTVTCKIVDHFRDAFPAYNCMVVHSEHLASLEGSVHGTITVKTGRFSNTTYDIYVFQSGLFTLLGDGGYINWCFGGNYHQEGSEWSQGYINSVLGGNYCNDQEGNKVTFLDP